MAEEKRVEVIYSQSGGFLSISHQMILVDKETGVQYLYMQSGNSGGLTPLLDADGKPVIKKESKIY